MHLGRQEKLKNGEPLTPKGEKDKNTMVLWGIPGSSKTESVKYIAGKFDFDIYQPGKSEDI